MNSKTNKILIVIGGIVIVGIAIFLLSYTYTVSGQVTDISNGKPIQGVHITVARQSSDTDEDGRYEIKGIKIYQNKSLSVVAPDQYVKTDTVVWNGSERSAKQDFTLEPKLEEIVRRALTGSKNGQYDYLWDLMHPDDRAYWGNREEYKTKLVAYKTAMEQFSNSSVKSSAVGENTRQIDTWRSPVTDKEYQNVVEVPIDYVLLIDGKEKFQTNLLYYQRVDGFYHYFITISKDDIKNVLDIYTAANK